MTIPKNFKGKKGRSGRKTKAQEMAGAIEIIAQQALMKLARSKVYKQINDFGDDFNVVKDLALPITLKGMTEKKDISSAGRELPIPILNILHTNEEYNGNEQKDKSNLR